MLRFFLAFFCSAFVLGYAQILEGQARVVDGDTLTLNGQKIRFLGIDAPEHSQECKDSKGTNYACGAWALKQLQNLVQGQKVRCVVSGKDKYQRHLATCFVGKTNVNAYMVERGAAFPYMAQTYFPQEKVARVKDFRKEII